MSRDDQTKQAEPQIAITLTLPRQAYAHLRLIEAHYAEDGAPATDGDVIEHLVEAECVRLGLEMYVAAKLDERVAWLREKARETVLKGKGRKIGAKKIKTEPANIQGGLDDAF